MMTQRRWLLRVLAGIAGILILGHPGPAQAQECMTTTAGPLTLTSGQALTVCATNLRGDRTVRLGVAFFDAFNAREPLQLEYFALAQRGGICTSFRPAHQSLTVVAQAGFMSEPEDSSPPFALSAQVSRSKAIEGPQPFGQWNDFDPAYVPGSELV